PREARPVPPSRDAAHGAVTESRPAEAGSHGHAGSRVHLGRVVRLAIAAGLTAYLLWRSHPADVLRAVAAADPWWIAAAVLLVLVDRALMAYRWIALLCIVDARVRPPL